MLSLLDKAAVIIRNSGFFVANIRLADRYAFSHLNQVVS